MKRGVGRAVTFSERSDHPLPSCRIRRICNRRAPGREELLFLELDPLPGRVADNTGESTVPSCDIVDTGNLVACAEDMRELDVPVEEVILAGQTGDQFLGSCRSERVVVIAEGFQRGLSDSGSPRVVIFRLDKRSTPGVGEQLLLAPVQRRQSSKASRCWWICRSSRLSGDLADYPLCVASRAPCWSPGCPRAE